MRICSVLLVFFTVVSALWPQPHWFEHGSTVLWLASNDTFDRSPLIKSRFANSAAQQTALYEENNLWSFPASEDVLVNAIDRLRYRMFSHSIVPRKFYPGNVDFEPSLHEKKKYISSVKFKLADELNADEALPDSDEAYSIEVNHDAEAVILFNTIYGALNALETFSQLFYAHSQLDNEVYTPFAPLKIKDGPAFKHRGLNLDISRNSISTNAVKRTIEAMASVKFNRLHIHASDAQSWPLDIPSMPNLARKGAYSVDQIWTADELKQVQLHGQLHGIQVYLEFDLPGHSTSIGNAYPDLITAANERNWSRYALEPPSGQLKLNSNAVKDFISSLLHDLLPRISPFSSLFHIGGDELNLQAYSLDDTVNSSSRAVLKPLLQRFTNDTLAHLASHGLQPIVWEELLLDWNLSLPDSTIVQTWRSPASLAQILARGHKALFGANSHWYLDCGHGAFLDPDPKNPDTPVRPPYEDYCAPYKNWRHVYSYDPLRGVPEEQTGLVLGGEVHLWGEMTDDVTLDGMLWPRAAAAAEVLWSAPGKLADEDTTRRLAELRERFVARSIGAGMVQMEWCLRNRGGCRL